MVFAKLKGIGSKPRQEDVGYSNPSILIVEDDPEQKALLEALVSAECKSLVNSTQLDANVGIITAHSLSSLRKVLSLYNNIFLVVLDCNIPDSKGEKPHDQFVREKYKISGQHRAVDLVLASENSPKLALVSAYNRFRKTVTQFYAQEKGIKLKFYRKSDAGRIQLAVRNALESEFL